MRCNTAVILLSDYLGRTRQYIYRHMRKINKKRKQTMIEELRAKALQLCAAHGITAQPYAGGWWLIGGNINRVVGELAGLSKSDLRPLRVVSR